MLHSGMFPRGPPKPRQDAAGDGGNTPSTSGVGRPAGWSMETPSKRGGSTLFGGKSSQVGSKPDDPAGALLSLVPNIVTGLSNTEKWHTIFPSVTYPMVKSMFRSFIQSHT